MLWAAGYRCKVPFFERHATRRKAPRTDLRLGLHQRIQVNAAGVSEDGFVVERLSGVLVEAVGVTGGNSSQLAQQPFVGPCLQAQTSKRRWGARLVPLKNGGEKCAYAAICIHLRKLQKEAAE
jgi:hypothetical protein